MKKNIIILGILLITNIGLPNGYYGTKPLIHRNNTEELTLGNVLCYKFGYMIYNIIIPEDLSDYPLAKDSPLTEYLFVSMMDESKIRNLSIKQLKSGFYYSDENPFNMYYLKGFEEYSKKLKNIDEFDLVSQKSVFIEKLVECWKNYNQEFERLMNKEIRIRIGEGWPTREEKLKNEFLIKGEDYYNEQLYKFYHPPTIFKLTKEDYNFDKQEMTFPFPCIGDWCGQGNNWSWTKQIKDAFNPEILKYAVKNRFIEFVPLETAKELVEPNTSGVYFADVKIKKIFTNNYQAGGYMYVQQFDLINFEMYYLNYTKSTPFYYSKTF